MNLKDYPFIYFLGIGGIGMSALARWFHAMGFKVGGYDKTSSALTQALASEGMDIHYDDQVGRIPSLYYQKAQTLVIYTPAIPQDNIELEYFRTSRYTLLKRAQVLGVLTENLPTLAVAGTHGKTTTSTLSAHLLQASGRNIHAFLGGISANYETNMLIGASDEYCVVEADEYDRSFLSLFPKVAIVTSTDADHLDIYGDSAQVEDAFSAFVQQIDPTGLLIYQAQCQMQIPEGLPTLSYGLKEGQVHANNIQIRDGAFYFDYVNEKSGLILEQLQMQVPGYHNVENALAAITAVLHLGVLPEQIPSALASFKGVKRRFEYHFKTPTLAYIDDYAHHPTELEALLSSAQAMYPDQEVHLIFQPHLFSRTRDFMDAFVQALSKADKVYLLDIYPAREKPIAGITSQALAERITTIPCEVLSKEKALELVASLSKGVIITAGAGDIDSLIVPIAEGLKNRYSEISK